MPPEIRHQAGPRWPATLALLAVGGLHYALPSPLTLGPDWLLLLLVAVLSIPPIVAHRRGMRGLNDTFGFVLLSVVTVEVIISLSLLISRLPSHKESPQQLLIAATGLWVSNLLLFASWYWRLDAGGPNEREVRGSQTRRAVL